MVVMVKGSNRWLALLGAAVIFSSVQVLSFDDGSSVSECVVDFFADGDCDDMNNNAACGYDSGDCCACTCESTDNFTCGDEGHGGYACIDPSAPCVDDDDVTAEMVQNCDVQSIGNGYCDMNNNNIECDYDGGDCCECTCDTAGTIDEYACSPMYGFACIDPSAPCVDDDSVTAEKVENCAYVLGIGNGYCDIGNNKVECDYDGGDCCECTCDTAGTDDESPCNPMNGFACIDPSAPCVDDDSVTVDMIENCDYAQGIGNGYCDNENNKVECNYDGGDCCECTCDTAGTTDEYACSNGFACIDPSAPCVDDDSVTVDMIENCGYVKDIGNGYCDYENNKMECAFDGGDCCDCTCVPNEDDGYSCSQFACIDSSAPCVDDDIVTIDMLDNCGWVMGIGDGHCNDDNNKAECAYDGGDCCECTCEPNEYQCREFACIDPEAACVDDDSITVDMFENCDDVYAIGNGFCDPDNNKIECGFDGGDCCSCTCEPIWDDDWSCSQNDGFECKDTSAPCFGEEITLYNNDDTDDFGSYDFAPWVQEGALPTVEGAVEVGAQTEVSISATAHDVRPGAHVGEVGCGEAGGNGCEAANSHDGISSEIESRWSCASKLLDDEGPCIIEYTFGAPQDIVDIQVAFWKGDERIRTLDVHLDGVYTHTHESYSGSTFNTLGVSGTGVTTVALESVELQPDEWISLIEVLIFVTPSTGDEDQSMSYNFVTP